MLKTQLNKTLSNFKTVVVITVSSPGKHLEILEACAEILLTSAAKGLMTPLYPALMKTPVKQRC